MDSMFLAEIIPHLDAVARQAFEVLAGMTPEASIDGTLPDTFEVEASVCYGGKQKAPNRLLIRANSRFAVDFSEGFLSLPTLMEVDEDVLDAMGELANTVAGNFKGLLTPDTILSTPVVSNRYENTESDQGGITLAEVTYTFPGNGKCLIKLLGPDSE